MNLWSALIVMAPLSFFNPLPRLHHHAALQTLQGAAVILMDRSVTDAIEGAA